MTQTSADNKRIAKNTLMLYFRMFFMMAVSLYTSRVVLATLGVEDYGIYNVVGGVVAMFGFINGAMSTATQRYLTFELGKGNFEGQQKVFTTSIQIHFLIALIVLALGETVGLWFIYEKMVIPPNRMDAALWVFQCSVLSTMVMIVSVPYNASIIAHEKMSAFAYISVIEAVTKLLIVYMLVIWDIDKLKLYAVLILIVQLFVRFIYGRYCDKHFRECKIIKRWDKPLFKEMLAFASWNLWGNCAGMLSSNGVNMLLNVFFGPVVNAARGIATQVQSTVNSFSSNFQMALNPQITKLYAQQDYASMHHLIIRSSRFSFFLLFAISLPIFLSTDYLLGLWLKEVPEFTSIFLQFYLVIVIIDSMANPLMVAASATGRVRKYQSIVGGVILLIVPLSYVALRMGFSPVSVFVVHLSVCISAFVVRLYIIKDLIRLNQWTFYKKLLQSILPVLLISTGLSFAIHSVLPPTGIVNVLALSFLSLSLVVLSTYLFGLESNERKLVDEKWKGIIHKYFQR